MIEYSVIIPAYNEAVGITGALTQVTTFMKNFSSSYEVIVVDDGSDDKTADTVEDYIGSHPEISVMRNSHKGKGYAIRTGVLASSGKYVLLADADVATPMEELKRLMVWIVDHDFDIAIASREGVGAVRKNEPYIRHIMGRVFNLIIRILVLPGIQDTQCGFKVFKGDEARNIFNRLVLFGPNTPEVEKPRVTAYDVEVLVIAKRLGYKVKSVPVSWTFVKTTRISPVRDSIANFLDVVKVKINDVLGKYNV